MTTFVSYKIAICTYEIVHKLIMQTICTKKQRGILRIRRLIKNYPYTKIYCVCICEILMYYILFCNDVTCKSVRKSPTYTMTNRL